jgi:hypothetical protein
MTPLEFAEIATSTSGEVIAQPRIVEVLDQKVATSPRQAQLRVRQSADIVADRRSLVEAVLALTVRPGGFRGLELELRTVAHVAGGCSGPRPDPFPGAASRPAPRRAGPLVLAAGDLQRCRPPGRAVPMAPAPA